MFSMIKCELVELHIEFVLLCFKFMMRNFDDLEFP